MTDLSEKAIALIMWERTVAAYSSALTGLYLDSWHEDLVEQLHTIATSALQDRTVMLAQKVLSRNDATVYVAGYELICELLERCQVQAKKRRAS